MFRVFIDISDYKKYKEIYKNMMKSEFRGKFQLNNHNKEYINDKGINNIEKQHLSL